MKRSLAVAFLLPAVAAGLYVAFRTPDMPGSMTFGISTEPCPSPLQIPAELVAYRKALISPDTSELPSKALGSKAMMAYRASVAERAQTDWANLCQYRAYNKNNTDSNTPKPVAVFMGDSITENWLTADPTFFADSRFISRGIGGQTTPQMLLRFRADVISLRPQVVHILAGTNDIAGNTGPTTLRDIQNNIESMVEIARANSVRVVLGSVLPASSFGWRPDIKPTGQIIEMNQWLSAYAAERGMTYVDYYSALANAEGGMKVDFTHDGVHPHLSGYALMEPLAKRAIENALKDPPPK